MLRGPALRSLYCVFSRHFHSGTMVCASVGDRLPSATLFENKPGTKAGSHLCISRKETVQPPYFQNRIPILLHLWEIYIFPGSVCLLCCSQICGPILGIYKSLTDTHCYKPWRDFLLPRPGAADSFRTWSKKSFWHVGLNFLLSFLRHRNFPAV